MSDPAVILEISLAFRMNDSSVYVTETRSAITMAVWGWITSASGFDSCEILPDDLSRLPPP
jgi:hypothetical protein